MSRMPILCYHNIGRPPSGSRFGLLYVSPEQLERQLWTLRRLGLRGVSAGEGVEHLESKAKGRFVVLTFDDGYADTLTEALPLLKQYGCTATCYLVSDAIGGYNTWDAGFLQEKKQLMSPAQVREWLAAGMEIGSHSCSHARLPELEHAALEREVAGSREALQKAFDVPIEHFCYPYGFLTAATVEQVRRAGYRSAVSLAPGPALPGIPLHRLPRILVNGDHGWLRFLLKVAAPYEYLVSWRWRTPPLTAG
jgi:peptidoglycan/xylan/chitin deacetylase (PgdA/CDA1 family)